MAHYDVRICLVFSVYYAILLYLLSLQMFKHFEVTLIATVSYNFFARTQKSHQSDLVKAAVQINFGLSVGV